jgi:large subunit ribosomal protein L21
MYAVIKTGGKQYRVAAEDIIEIERTGAAEGDLVEFSDVLMVADGNKIEVGSPILAGATVAGQVKALSRGPKIIVFKKKRRKHYRRRNGHRQDLMQVEITEILTGGKKPSKKVAPKKEVAATKATEPSSQPTAQATGEVKDDVELIGGVGPALKKKLAGAGVTSLKQIAEMKKEDLAKLDEQLKLGGRTEREEWQEQAKELLAGKPPRAKVDQEKK